MSLINFISFRLIWIREIGIMDCIRRRWFPRKPPCEGSLGFNSIGLTEVRPALLLLLFGFVATISVLLIEILYNKFQKKHQKKIAHPKKRLFKDNTI